MKGFIAALRDAAFNARLALRLRAPLEVKPNPLAPVGENRPLGGRVRHTRP
jgi:hypothetical protein